MSSGEALFDAEFLRKLEQLQILSKRALGQFRADRRARKAGSGLEFAAHRGYAPGDDFRRVDWLAYQRLEKLLLRLFEEEADLAVYLFVDASRSMAHGSPSKFDYARQIAGALCYIGLANLDRVTLLAYADRLGRSQPPQRGKRQIFQAFRFLRDLEAVGDTDAAGAFTTFCRTRRPVGLVVVVSDFLDPRGFEAGLNVLRYAGHEVFALHIVDATEARPEIRGDVLLVDAEEGTTREFTATPARLAAYGRMFDRFCGDLTAYCSKYGFGYLRTATSLPVEEAILRVFRQGRFLR